MKQIDGHILLPLLKCCSSLGSSIRRCNAFCVNIRFRIFCSYHFRSCVMMFFSGSLYDVWSFEHVMYGQQSFCFFTITQPRGGGKTCSGHTRNAHIKFAFIHLQLRHGSMVGTNEPFANLVLLCAHPETITNRTKTHTKKKQINKIPMEEVASLE